MPTAKAPPMVENSDPLVPMEWVTRSLLHWYKASHRDLPWRRTRDPYAIWVSEVMLQQTRVDTVIPYYDRFIARFPSVDSLAAADLDAVLPLWSGLGYYRRARQLHAGAQAVMRDHGGVVPREVSALRSLSGVGAYTAGAIASIAYDAPEPLVDGNVMRVLARLFALRDAVDSPPMQKVIWGLAAKMVPTTDAGSFNQALMELGATVCFPRAPRCGECPLREHCRAKAIGIEEEIPVKRGKRAPSQIELVAAVVRAGGKVLLAQRGKSGLFAGMWEPPMVESFRFEELANWLTDSGVTTQLKRCRGRVRHVLTHRILDVSLAVASLPRAKKLACDPAALGYEQVAWSSVDGGGRALSTLACRIIGATCDSP